MEIKPIQASQTWQIRHEVMWPDQPFEFVQLEEDNSGFHFGVFEDHKLVSIISCFIEGKEMQFRKLATLSAFQGKGIASHLLEYILQFAKERDLEKVWCNARTNKKSFYEKFGMKDTFKTFTKAGQEYTIMEINFLK
ncbi:N-acetyltransferase [Flavobacterium sp. WLB]|uniref:GNAT family N-acetyltransferase n=1 Tax=unclassified Flavobacterium TaxID=196869 RepID=UPI0006AB8FDB|nr:MULTISPECIES: GNAT family N-acetyltransferase [unclassified Flavobacterium]KOP36374.1 GNAT family acetyltransferase [Flavobacterium sp. VMW]OWU90351.1 GNAT family acetyltransferase [Flavobacterium sp. NLM]PUU67792.1 N-acetyltransferase [Flavobacterium sp. WLB]